MKGLKSPSVGPRWPRRHRRPVAGGSCIAGSSLTAIVAAGLLVCAVAPAGDPPAEHGRSLEGEERRRFLETVEKRITRMQTLVAEFRQETALGLFKDTVRSSGVILFSRSGSGLRWEIRAPFRSMLVVSGDRVGKFEYVEGHRRSLRLGGSEKAVLAVMDQIRSWFSGRFDEDRGAYELTAYEKPSPRLLLTPRDSTVGESIKEIEMNLCADLSAVEKVVLRESSGDRTEMSFREIRRDAILDGGLFSVTDPVELDLDAIREAPILRSEEGS